MHAHRDPSLSTKGDMGGCEQQGSSKEYRGSLEQELQLSQAAAIKGSSIGATCMKKVRNMSNKRRSRALAKPPIRVLSADKSAFRDLVLYFTGNPSSSPPPPPSLLAYTHPTTTYTPPSSSSSSPPPPSLTPPPSFPFSNPSYPHLDALLTLTNSPLSFPNPLTSQSHTPFSSLSSSHSTSPSDGASFHSSPFPSLNTSSLDATLMHSDNKFSKTLEFLQALKQSLLHIKSLGECGSFNFGLLAPSNHDTISNKGGDLKPLLRTKPDHTPKSTNTYGADGDFLKPLLRTQVDHHTPKSTDTYVGDRMVDMKSLDREHSQNLRQAAELENFLLTIDEKLDDLFTSNLFHNVKS